MTLTSRASSAGFANALGAVPPAMGFATREGFGLAALVALFAATSGVTRGFYSHD
jgi:hypothetical protein